VGDDDQWALAGGDLVQCAEVALQYLVVGHDGDGRQLFGDEGRVARV
jgi:hypothetical protein